MLIESAVALILAASTPAPVKAVSHTDHKRDAFMACQTFVGQQVTGKKTWRNPKGDQVTYGGADNDHIVVNASVDVGGLRRTYACTVAFQGKSMWALTSLTVGQPVAPTTVAPGATAATSPPDRRHAAFDVCKQFVTDRLKAPSGAKWRDPDGDQVSYTGGPGDGPYIVLASVDAQNAFGAKLRTAYVCTVKRDPSTDRWNLINLTFDE